MIKVLLVDDEPIIVKGLRKLILWESLGCEIIGEAYDGEEAYEFIKENKPDIVITDLLMPTMDGIEFIKRLNEDGINIEIIILSGHGEFEYAQDALKFGVFEYLLKPVTREKLTETVRKILEKINVEINYSAKIEKIKAQLRETMPLFKDKLILNVLRGEMQDSEDIKKKAELFDIDFNGFGYTVFAIEIDDIADIDKFSSEKDKLLLTFAVENIASEIIRNHSAGYLVASGEVIYVLLNIQDRRLSNNEISEIIEEIKDCLSKYLNISVSIGIGRQYSDILQIKKSFEEANKALKSKFIVGKNSIIHINNIVPGEYDKYLYPENSEKQVLDSILYNTGAGSKELAEYLLESFTKASVGNTELIYNFCMEFLIQLRRSIRTFGGEACPFLDLKKGEEKIRKCKTIHDLKDWLSATMEKSLMHILNIRKNREYDAIQEAKNYIDVNFSENLSLNKVASKVFMSPTYFSALFKSKTGENFCDYLSKVRMENAASMLTDSKFKTFEVSETVGYKNPRYFSDAFKRYHGLTPTEFREKNGLK
jgi:two-component system, response regulator YesN